jgi:hypothetical protein
MGRSAPDGGSLFRQPPVDPADEDVPSVPDGSREAMRRHRFPFEAKPAEAAEQAEDAPPEGDGS